MLEILLTILSVALFFWLIKLLFKLTWSIAKIIAVILLVNALPTLIGGIMVAGGFVLLIPVALLASAIGTVKVFAC